MSDDRSNFIVSITPQAISLATDPNFWSQVYLLWLISMMLPKFTLMWVKAAFTAWESYPIGLNLVIAWFEMVELSFIPVFAIVFLVCTKM
ncbi:hypothetical protein V5799_004546, partial [Amblyomma americanum]